MTYVEYLRKVREAFDLAKSPTNFICPANSRCLRLFGLSDDTVRGHYQRLDHKIQSVLVAASNMMGTRTSLLSTYWIRSGKFGMKSNYHMLPDAERTEMAHVARLAFLDRLIAYEEGKGHEPD